MKTADQWFEEYGESHQNPQNKTIHWICVPLIFWSVIGLLAAIPHAWMDAFFPANIQPYVNYGTLLVVLGSLFYLRMSPKLFLGLILFSALCVYLCALVEGSGYSLGYVSLAIFVVAWIGQFIGHKIEGKKPSFLKDLQFLLIGPAWLMHFIYKKLGLSY